LLDHHLNPLPILFSSKACRPSTIYLNLNVCQYISSAFDANGQTQCIYTLRMLATWDKPNRPISKHCNGSNDGTKGEAALTIIGGGSAGEHSWTGGRGGPSLGLAVRNLCDWIPSGSLRLSIGDLSNRGRGCRRRYGGAPSLNDGGRRRRAGRTGRFGSWRWDDRKADRGAAFFQGSAVGTAPCISTVITDRAIFSVRAAGVSGTRIVTSIAKTIHRSRTKTLFAARRGYLINRAKLSLVERRSSE